MVNNISDGKTKLLSEEYVDNRTPLLFRCSCGNTFYRTLGKFKTGRILCDECKRRKLSEKYRYDLEYIKSEIEKKGCHYISGDYENSKSLLCIQCNCGNIFYRSWEKFMSRSHKCADCGKESLRESKRKYYPENAKQILSEYGYTMVGDFINAATKVKCICSRGHECDIVLSALISERHTGCWYCGHEDISGEKNWNYKGGISMFDDDIRNSLLGWKNNIRDLYEHKCPISQEDKLNTDVHHLYSLNSIYNDVINELGIKAKYHDTIANNNISTEDKQNIINSIIKKHTNETGILISKDIHKAFHKEYGYGGNTPEQFDEFLRNNYSLTLDQIIKK